MVTYIRQRRAQELAVRVALLISLCTAGASAARGDERLYVTDGAAQHTKTESGTWVSSNGYLASASNGATISIGDILTTGDFRFTATLRGERFDTNPGLLLINNLGQMGFVSSDAKSTIYIRGFFFGDITRNLSHRSAYFADDEDFNVEVSRTGDLARVLINGQTVWRNTFEGHRQFGKIGFRNHTGGLKVKSASLINGNYAPVSEWENPQTKVYEQPGEQADVFRRGQGDYHTYRIPAIERTRSGVLLAFCEGRRNSGSDSGSIDLLVKRSLDGGLSWGEPIVVHSEPGNVTIGNPTPVHIRQFNRTELIFCRNNDRVFQTTSRDEGITWDTPREITSQVKLPTWNWYATGPGHGLITSSGRIIIPANHGSAAHSFFSDDHGSTWKLGGTMPGYGNEVTAAERADGSILMNSRNITTAFFRKQTVSTDGGASWQPPENRPDLVEPTCQGSLRSVTMETGEHLLLFSNPASVRRERLTVRTSDNGGTTWSEGRTLYGGSAAYSDLCYLGGGWFGCLYERDWYDKLTFARFHISWLRESGIENWNEEVAPAR